MLLVAEEEHEFKVDLRIEGIPQDAVLEAQDRMTKIKKNGGQATSWIPYRIDHCRFGKRKIHQVQRRIESYTSRIGKY